MRPRTILLWLLGIASIPFVLIILIVVFAQLNDLQLRIRGYHVMSAGWELGEMLATQDGSVNECLKFRSPTFDIMTPSRGEHVGMCVRKYAELKKDPSACELLMPSSYGLSCVGGAEVSLPCDVTNIPYSVYWRDGDIEHTEHLRGCLQPKNTRSALGNQCCEVAKVAMLKNENDCSSLTSNTPVYDHCLYALAWKLKEPNHCNGITNENARAACQVQTKALKQDPSICSGCTPPVESVDDVPDL